MKSTRHQVPDMRGRRTHRFGCGCCEAIDKRAEYEHRRAIAEARESEAHARRVLGDV